MTKNQCLKNMKAPGDMRGTAIYGVMQILVTNRCDGGMCSNCTQMLPYQHGHEDMTPENFLLACESLIDYPGVVGMMGGNPCLHPQFDELCDIMAEVLPNRAKRGIWTNNLNGHGKIVNETFGYYNFNVHGNAKAGEEMRDTCKQAKVWGEELHSLHGAVMVAMSDLVPDKDTRYKIISSCDINQRWSPAIVQRNGKLKGFFCEVAAAWSAVYNDKAGVKIVPEWWKMSMDRFATQVERYCHGCGCALRLKGHYDYEKKDDVSHSTQQLAEQANREHVNHSERDSEARELTDYQRLRGE